MPGPNPSSCQWCGIDQRTHSRQWTAEAGWHQWTQPTQQQLKDRMRARHAARTPKET